jgi:hypothetical protein
MRRALLLLPLLAAPAAAQDIPACTQDRVGAVACMAGKLCACGYQRGGSVSGRPDGYAWDCGVLRPQCGEAVPPATIGGFPTPLPQLILPLPQPAFPPPPMSPWLR